jgi:hypothetical protein
MTENRPSGNPIDPERPVHRQDDRGAIAVTQVAIVLLDNDLQWPLSRLSRPA